jgi:tetratricopeptide (TPR) repeat protein
MLKRYRLPGLILVLLVVALALPQLASVFFLNLANTQIARALALPSDAPRRAAFLADAGANLARSLSYSRPARGSLAQARLALAQNDPAHAISIFDEADAATRNDFIAQFIWGETLWRAGQREAALEHWRTAGGQEYFRQALIRGGFTHQWQPLEEFARIAIGLEPDFALAHYVLADALAKQDPKNPEALRELELAGGLTQDPEILSTILSRRGEILASLDRLKDALDSFSQARAIAPTDARPRTDYALVALRIDPNARVASITLLTQVVNDSPRYVEAYIALSQIAEDNAEAWLKMGLERNPNNAALLFALGQYYARQDRIGEARAAMISAIQNEKRADLLQQYAQALQVLPAP